MNVVGSPTCNNVRLVLMGASLFCLILPDFHAWSNKTANCALTINIRFVIQG